MMGGRRGAIAPENAATIRVPLPHACKMSPGAGAFSRGTNEDRTEWVGGEENALEYVQ